MTKLDLTYYNSWKIGRSQGGYKVVETCRLARPTPRKLTIKDAADTFANFPDCEEFLEAIQERHGMETLGVIKTGGMLLAYSRTTRHLTSYNLTLSNLAVKKTNLLAFS
jgi:hypothetical protein